ncbi:MAG: hypothetical protein ACI9VO_002318 [Colwellia sp.]
MTPVTLAKNKNKNSIVDNLTTDYLVRNIL